MDSFYIPTGSFEYVEDTPYNFDIAESIGSRINEIDSDPVGYDVNYLLWGLNGTEALEETHDCIVYEMYVYCACTELLLFDTKPALQLHSVSRQASMYVFICMLQAASGAA